MGLETDSRPQEVPRLSRRHVANLLCARCVPQHMIAPRRLQPAARRKGLTTDFAYSLMRALAPFVSQRAPFRGLKGPAIGDAVHAARVAAVQRQISI